MKPSFSFQTKNKASLNLIFLYERLYRIQRMILLNKFIEPLKEFILHDKFYFNYVGKIQPKFYRIWFNSGTKKVEEICYKNILKFYYSVRRKYCMANARRALMELVLDNVDGRNNIIESLILRSDYRVAAFNLSININADFKTRIYFINEYNRYCYSLNPKKIAKKKFGVCAVV